MKPLRSLALVAASMSLAFALPAMAHTRIVSSTPAAGANTKMVRTVSLTFNEAFLPKLSGLDIVMTGMPGMAGHQPMKITGVKVTPSADHKSLTATLAKPLPAGSYDVNWHAVGDDTHRMTGKISFKVG